MGLNSKKRIYLTAFAVVSATVYIIALVLVLVSSPKSAEISDDDFKLFENSIVTRSAERHDTGIIRQNIRMFESSYVPVKPRKDHEEHKDYNNQDMETLKKQQFEKYSFNELRSSKIALDRRIPDNRPEK